MIYNQPRKDRGLCGFLFALYLEKCFIQIYRAFYGDAHPVGAHPDGRQHGDREVTETSIRS